MNAQGLCRRCNLAKEAPGWISARAPDGTVTTTTPTGHTYTSTPPPVLVRLPGQGGSVVELHFVEAWWQHSRAG